MTKGLKLNLNLNGKPIENPIIIAAVVFGAFMAAGSLLMLMFLLLLPFFGIAITVFFLLVAAVITPLVLWLLAPVLILSLFNRLFGKPPSRSQ